MFLLKIKRGRKDHKKDESLKYMQAFILYTFAKRLFEDAAYR